MAPNSGSGPTGSDLAGLGFFMAAAVLIPFGRSGVDLGESKGDV